MRRTSRLIHAIAAASERKREADRALLLPPPNDIEFMNPLRLALPASSLVEEEGDQSDESEGFADA